MAVSTRVALTTIPDLVPFQGYHATVLPEWIDENDHMNLAYYVVVFDQATDALWSTLGLNEGYRARTGAGTFAVEAHIIYRAELLLGDRASVTTQILAADTKRIHLAHEMRRGSTIIAQNELMLLSVDLQTRRVVPFRGGAAERISAAARAHALLPTPCWVGRCVAMNRPAPAA